MPRHRTEADLSSVPKLYRCSRIVAFFKFRKLRVFKFLHVGKDESKKGKKRKEEKGREEQNRRTVGRGHKDKGETEKRGEMSQLCAGDHLLERAGIADGDRWEVHGLEAHGERDADLPAQVGLDEDAPLPAHQAGEEQREQEPHGLLLGPLADDAFGAVCVGVVAVPH